MPQRTENATQADMKSLIEECQAVAPTASSCATNCVESFGTEMAECIRLCLDAATVAEATALLAARGSPFVKQMSVVAGDVFHKCAVVCDAHAEKHETLRRSAGACDGAYGTSRAIGAGQ